MGIMNVTHLKACTLTRQTTRSEGRETTLMGNFCQGVGLIHELAQSIGSKEGIDNTAYGLGINQIGGSEHLIVTNIHALANGASHTSQTYSKLIA